MAIRHKRKALSGYTWQPTDLVDGQIGVNTVDGTLHVLKTDNTIFEIAHDKTVWKGPWVDASYKYNEMTRDGDWTMVCVNPAGTTDRPSPQPIGSPEDSLNRDLVFTENSFVGIVEMRHKFTLEKNGWLKELYVKVPEFTADTIARVTVHNVTKDISQVMNYVILTADAWTLIALDWRPVGIGTDFGVRLELYNSTGAANVSGRWDSKQGTGTPNSQEFNIDNLTNPTVINIDHTDLTGTDRSTELDTIPVGSILLINETGSIDRNVKVEVTSVDTTPTTYTSYNVTVLSNGNKDIRDGKTCTLTFDLPITLPTRYYVEPDYYIGTTNQPSFATFSSELYYDGILQTDIDDAYGIGVVFQESYISSDWQLISVSGASAIGDQSTSVTIVDNLTSIDATAALSANMGRELNDTKADINHVHALPDLTDVILTNPIANDLLLFDGTNWINQTKNDNILHSHNGTVTQTFNNAIVVNFNTIIRQDSNYTLNALVGGTDILFNKAGWYKITYTMSITNTTSTRSRAEAGILKNNILVDGSLAYSYHRNNTDGESSSTKSIVIQMAVNDTLHVSVRSADNQVLQTLPNACSIIIEALD